MTARPEFFAALESGGAATGRKPAATVQACRKAKPRQNEAETGSYPANVRLFTRG